MISRRAGILLHPTSLPGPFGVGDLGPMAETFLDFLRAAGQGVWQVLPLGPPAWAGSPYGCLSAFAGNPLLISPEWLREDGLLALGELAASPFRKSPGAKVNFGRAAAFKELLLRRAYDRFRRGEGAFGAAEVAAFRTAQASWLEEWILFAALKAEHRGRPFWEWKRELALGRPASLRKAELLLRDEIGYHAFVQYVFERQWQRLRAGAHARGIRLMGDLPIYVAHDSADVWAHPALFDLDEQRRPRHVAGVPPDYFSKDGQLWGNPLYHWPRMLHDGFRWWRARLRANLRQTDLVRLDHFRGFAGYWQVPAGEKTAKNGRWMPAPGNALFTAFTRELGHDLPLVAEDLGEITPDVHQLRAKFGLPGIRVLQFGFGAEPNEHSPHRLEKNQVVYTGTHDNDTTAGWFRKLAKADKERVKLVAGAGGRDLVQGLIRVAYASIADLALTPMQDVLGLGSAARMNTPGKSRGNWAWRLSPAAFRKAPADHLRQLAAATERLP